MGAVPKNQVPIYNTTVQYAIIMMTRHLTLRSRDKLPAKMTGRRLGS